MASSTSSIYFAYGSNMWRDQMVRRCPDSKHIGIAFVKDWKWFICERGYANIIKSPGDKVYGLVYELPESDERKLDRHEGVPKDYTKEHLPATFLGTKEQATERQITVLVYIDELRTSESQPKTEYIFRMNMGIADAIREGVPEDYIEANLRKFIARQ